MAVIKEDCRGISQKITMEVLREWLAGKGVKVLWDSLIATLRDQTDTNSSQPTLSFFK